MIKLFFYSSFFKYLLIIFPISLLIIFFYLLYLDHNKKVDFKGSVSNEDLYKASDSNNPLNIILCSIILVFCALVLLILLFLNFLS